MSAHLRSGVLVLLAVALAACSGGSGGPACSFGDPGVLATSSAWPKFRHDPQNTGSAANVQLAAAPSCLWAFPPGGAGSCSSAPAATPTTTPVAAASPGPAGSAFAASAVLNSDGTRIYIGSQDGTMYALNTADGTAITPPTFSFSNAQPITSTALVARRTAGEVIFFGGSDGLLYGLTNTGEAQLTNWPAALGGFISGSPNIGTDGTVYVASLNGMFVGVCPNGVERFVVSSAGTQSSPAQAPDGTLYFGAEDALLHAAKADGTAKWTFSAAAPIVAGPVFDSDTNSIYVADRSGRVFKLTTDGRPDSSFVFGPVGPISSSPALAGDHLYVGSDDGRLYAIDKCTGAVAWSVATGGVVFSSPAVAVGGPLQPATCTAPPPSVQRTVVVGSNSGRVYFLSDDGQGATPLGCFDVATRAVIACPANPALAADQPNAVKSSPAIGSDGTVYVGADDGHVYAIGTR